MIGGWFTSNQQAVNPAHDPAANSSMPAPISTAATSASLPSFGSIPLPVRAPTLLSTLSETIWHQTRPPIVVNG